MRQPLTEDQVLQLWLEYRNTKKVIAMTGWRMDEVCNIIKKWRNKYYAKKVKARMAAEKAGVQHKRCSCGCTLDVFDFTCLACCLRSIGPSLPEHERAANWAAIPKPMKLTIAEKLEDMS